MMTAVPSARVNNIELELISWVYMNRIDKLIMVFLRHNYMGQVLRVSLRISGISATPYLAVIIV
jgi:hypothetical protein